MPLADPNFRILPNQYDGVRRSADQLGEAGLSPFHGAGSITLQGSNHEFGAVQSLVLDHTPGQITIQGQNHEFGVGLDLEHLPGSITIDGKNHDLTLVGAWLPISEIRISPPYPVTVDNIKADHYLGSQSDPFEVADANGDDLVATGVVVYDNAIDRMTMQSDIGAVFPANKGLQLNPVAATLESDFADRIASQAVIGANEFATDEEVDAYRWEGGYAGIYGGGHDPDRLSPNWNQCRRITTDGITGGGCLEVIRGAGFSGQPWWWRPYSPSAVGTGAVPANRSGYNIWPGPATTNISGWQHGNVQHVSEQGAPERIGDEIYQQFRLKIDPVVANPGTFTNFGGKYVWLGTRTEASLTAQEIIMNTGDVVGAPADLKLVNFNRDMDGRNVGGGAQGIIVQPGTLQASDRQPGSDLLPVQHQYPYGTWGTYLVRLKAGRENDNNSQQFFDTEVTIWYAAYGETSYTKVWDYLTYGFDWQNAYNRSWNSFIFSNWHNTTYSGDQFYTRMDQYIISTEFIACPQVYA